MDVYWSSLAPGLLFRTDEGSVEISDLTLKSPVAPSAFAAAVNGKVKLFRPGETLALHIWASRTEALAANAAQMANLSSAILMLLVLSFSLGARYLSTYLDTKTGGSRK